MLLTDARRPARIDPNGALIPLADQDRAAWNRDMITEGIALVTAALSSAPLGPYQVQAAIAAVHSEAPDTASTDWPQILGLFALLEQITPSPVVTLNRAVALAMVYGPQAGLRLLDGLDGDRQLASQHRPRPRSAATCTRWPVTAPRRAPPTWPPPAGPPASPRNATSSARQPPSPARSPGGYQMRARVGVTRITCG